MGRLLWLSLTDEGLRKLTCRAVSRRLEMARATREGAALISAIDCQLGENRPTRSPRLIAGRNSGSWRMVANPDRTPFSGNFLIGGYSTGTRNFRTERLDEYGRHCVDSTAFPAIGV